jgi:16S rRNA (guanine966-N2)-methyltransferase
VRIVAGAWRGRRLAAPPGTATRPTADKVRQALFDMLLHAPWGGRGTVAGARVLDAFAGTGALGLEALSRGAAHATFVEHGRAALAALRANVAACGAADRASVLAGDVTRLPPGEPFSLIFLDPPYGQGLVEAALAALARARRIAPGALVVAEAGRDETLPAAGDLLAERAHGGAKIVIWRLKEEPGAPPLDPAKGREAL